MHAVIWDTRQMRWVYNMSQNTEWGIDLHHTNTPLGLSRTIIIGT